MASHNRGDRGITAHTRGPNEGWFTTDIEGKVRYRAGMVIKQFGTIRGDIDDLAQSAFLRVASAMQRFDPARATAAAFIRGVLDQWYQETCRTCRKARSRGGARKGSLVDHDRLLGARVADPRDEVDRCLDTRSCLAKLREADAQAARDSVTIRRNETAKLFRKKRAAYRRYKERLRVAFSDLDPANS